MNIFDLVKSEEASYKVTPVPVHDGYDWNMYNHLRLCVLYKHGKRLDNETPDDEVPVQNIILPIVNVSYRTEGFDVKDIEPYVNSDKDFHKSFLVRKYHDLWALENRIDQVIDQSVESYVDFGGVLMKDGKDGPEVVPLQQLAFCDQTDILGGPFAIKHQFSIDQLKAMPWDKEAINRLIAHARKEKTNTQQTDKESKTPGKYIEVYEVHGMFPTAWVTEDTDYYEETDEDSYSRQVHIISYMQGDDSKTRFGVHLFKGKEKNGLFKVLKRTNRFGTALGESQITELAEPQVWTTYSHIQMKKMLDKAAIILGITDDPTFAQKNKLGNVQTGEFLKKQTGTTVEPFVFPESNITRFTEAVNRWENHARTIGSANEAILGVSPSSGTPFKLQDLVVNENKGMHEWRQGQLAAFWEEIYRDWVLPRLVKKINNGQKFLSELSLDEMQEVADKVANNQVNEEVKKRLLQGQVVMREQVEGIKALVKESFMKSGTKKFIELVKDEVRDIPVDVRINVAGKQKNLAAYVDKLSNIVRQVMSNPAVLQDPNSVKLLNTIFEASGISPINFSQAVPSPMQPLLTEPLTQTNG